jgi:hypothetical protein
MHLSGITAKDEQKVNGIIKDNTLHTLVLTYAPYQFLP